MRNWNKRCLLNPAAVKRPRILRRLVILLLVVLVAAALDSQDPINTLISYDPPRGDS